MEGQFNKREASSTATHTEYGPTPGGGLYKLSLPVHTHHGGQGQRSKLKVQNRNPASRPDVKARYKKVALMSDKERSTKYTISQLPQECMHLSDTSRQHNTELAVHIRGRERERELIVIFRPIKTLLTCGYGPSLLEVSEAESGLQLHCLLFTVLYIQTWPLFQFKGFSVKQSPVLDKSQGWLDIHYNRLHLLLPAFYYCQWQAILKHKNYRGIITSPNLRLELEDNPALLKSHQAIN